MERDIRKEFAIKRIEARKRLIFLGLHRKSISRQETCTVYVGHRHPPGLPRE